MGTPQCVYDAFLCSDAVNRSHGCRSATSRIRRSLTLRGAVTGYRLRAVEHPLPAPHRYQSVAYHQQDCVASCSYPSQEKSPESEIAGRFVILNKPSRLSCGSPLLEVSRKHDARHHAPFRTANQEC
jgi:hypothetical protein